MLESLEARPNHRHRHGAFDDHELKTGVWRRYYPNGKLLDEGHFEKGKKIGNWKTYAETGRLKKQQSFAAK